MYEKTMVLLQATIDELNSATPTPTPAPDMAGKVTEGLAGTSSSLDSFWQLLGLVFLLIVILIATYFTTRFVGQVKLGQMKKSNFQVIDAYRISPNKVVQIVKIGNKYIVLGIGKDTVNYITELDEAEVLVRELHTGEKMSFKQILEKYRKSN
jgi:flagellar protein FliO/FliZ